MSGILRTPLAEADLLSIGRYVAEHSQSTSAALRLLDGIDEKCRILARHPHVGEARPDLGEKIRMLPVSRHIIFYRPFADGIEVIRVLHEARDIPVVFHRSK